ALVDLTPREAEERAVEVDVLAPRELGMEPGPELEQRGDPARRRHRPLVRHEDLRHALEQRRLATAVVGDEPERLGAADVERDVVEGPELLVLAAAAVDDHRLQRVVAQVVAAEAL